MSIKTFFSTAFLLFISFLAQGQDAKAVAKRVLPAVVHITMKNEQGEAFGNGSGIILSKNLIATNFHVIDDVYGLSVTLSDGTELPVQGYVAIDRKNDLAILSVSGLPAVGLSPAAKDAEVGEKIYTVGSPQGLSQTFAEGIVSNAKRVFGDRELLQIDASISAGSSGGAVVNAKAEIVGVVVSSIDAGQNLNFSVPVRFLKELFKKQEAMKTFPVDAEKKEGEKNINLALAAEQAMNEPASIGFGGEQAESWLQKTLALFEGKNAEVNVVTPMGILIDRYSIIDYLERLSLLRRYKIQLTKIKPSADKKSIAGVFVQEEE